MNFYDELKKIHTVAVGLFKTEYGHEINNN